MKQCSKCGASLQPEWRLCPNCGMATNAPSFSIGRVFVALVVLITAGVLLGPYASSIISLNTPNNATVSNPTPASTPFSMAPATRTVTYKVSGTASAVSLTYQTPQGSSVQIDASLPWSVDQTFKDGDFAYVSAQNKGEDGTVTTEIYVDGKPWKSTTSEGAYKIADASGSVELPAGN